MKRTIRILFSSIVKGCFAGVLTLIFAPPLARAQLFTLSSITGWWDYDSAAIREVDPATGATISFQPIPIRPPPGAYGLYTTGLAAHPTTGEFFALVETAPSPTGPICQHLLAKIDPATGAATIIGNTGDCFDSLAFHSNGTLYGVTGAVPPALFTLDTTSATPTFLISLDAVGGSSGAVAGGSALAFNPSDGLLYRSGRVDDSDQIFQAIDPDTLAVTDIPLSGSPTNGITALTHSSGITLLGADAGNRLFSITTEGVRTLIGPMDHLARGLAFATYGTPDLSLTELTVNLASPQPPGIPITFTATASGGTSPTEFKWWIRDGGVWFVAQDWSTNNTVIWTPAVAGDYGIAVWARSNGNPDDAPENNAFAGMNFSIAADDPCYGCWDY